MFYFRFSTSCAKNRFFVNCVKRIAQNRAKLIAFYALKDILWFYVLIHVGNVPQPGSGGSEFLEINISSKQAKYSILDQISRVPGYDRESGNGKISLIIMKYVLSTWNGNFVTHDKLENDIEGLWIRWIANQRYKI